MAMRTLIASFLAAAAWTVLAVPVRAGDDSASVTVTLRASTETEYAEVVKILKALREAQVREIKLEIAGQQEPGVSAAVRARSGAPYKAVLKAVEALQGAGVRKATLNPEP
jgi:biopolymer transport protein ExbD